MRRYGSARRRAAPSGTQFRERATHTSDVELASAHSAADRFAHGMVAAPVEQIVQLLDATARELRLAMRDLGEQHERVAAEIEKLLPLLVELRAGAVHGGDLGGAMLREWLRRLVFASSAMPSFEATRDDVKSILVEEERACDVRRFRRIEYVAPSKTTSAVGPTKIGMRSASFSGKTLIGRRRASSSCRRVSGITFVAREGVFVLTSSCHATSCARRSASS